VTERGAICRGSGKGRCDRTAKSCSSTGRFDATGFTCNRLRHVNRRSPPSKAASHATDQEHLGLLLVCFSLMATRAATTYAIPLCALVRVLSRDLAILDKVVPHEPTGIAWRPVSSAHDVVNACADGLVPGRRQHLCLCRSGMRASCVAQNLVPISTPSAPSMSDAARPRPSAMPPAASTRTSGARAVSASTTDGTNGIVERSAQPCPPASVP
jgi:hypothetical protein